MSATRVPDSDCDLPAEPRLCLNSVVILMQSFESGSEERCRTSPKPSGRALAVPSRADAHAMPTDCGEIYLCGCAEALVWARQPNEVSKYSVLCSLTPSYGVIQVELSWMDVTRTRARSLVPMVDSPIPPTRPKKEACLQQNKLTNTSIVRACSPAACRSSFLMVGTSYLSG